MLFEVSLLVKDSFNKVFVVMFDPVNIETVLDKHLVFPAFSVKFKPISLLYAHLDISDFIGLPPGEFYLREHPLFLELQ
jgi:hypothetical protein